MRIIPWLSCLYLLAFGSVHAQLDTGPAGDAPFRQLPPPAAADGSVTAAEILNGVWGNSQGRTYQLAGGRFSRDGKPSMQLDCERKVDIEAITPIFECEGAWYERNGAEGGRYRGMLYWSGRRQSWYLEGAYSFAAQPDRWYGLNYGPGEGTEPVRPPIYQGRVTASAPGASGSVVPNGLWASGDARYEVAGGVFWRDGQYPTLRLVCDRAGDGDASYDCTGAWYGKMGEQAGSYRGPLSWKDDPGYWFFEGLYNYLEEPDRWYGKNFTQLEGPDGGRPSATVARREPPAESPTAPTAGDQPGAGSDQGPSTGTSAAGGNGSRSPSDEAAPPAGADLDDILQGVDDPRLAGCLSKAYEVLLSAKLKITDRHDNALYGHDADFRARVRCPRAGDAFTTTAVTVISRNGGDPVPFRDKIVGAMQ